MGETAHGFGPDREEEPGLATLGGADTGSAQTYAQELGPGVRPFPGGSLATAALRNFVAVDPASVRLLDEIGHVATAATTILLRGETGTGKNSVAALMHYLGPRPEEPLLGLKCSSLPREIIETELFGYEHGAVGGADGAKWGRLELAGAGTLVLDEIAALPMPVQARLLRAIEEKRCERPGGASTVRVRARIVALTSVDLAHAVARRTFREDLYYRLNVVPLQVPPLRDRRADIAPLAEFFLARAAVLYRRRHLRFQPAALQALKNYGYPGNVEELRILVERAAVCARGVEITVDDLPAHVQGVGPGYDVRMSLEDIERRHISAVLEHTRGKKTVAAGILGISRKTLLEKRKRYRLP